MIRVRVDDFPHTSKREPQHTREAFRDFHRRLSASIGGRRYLLGVIPRQCDPDDIMLLREIDAVLGMHGIDHDESRLDLHQNEFPPYFSEQQIGRALLEASSALDIAVGRRTEVYMPPRNRINRATFNVLHDCGFYGYTTGPETEPEFIAETDGPFAIHSEKPHEYGRTDEMWAMHSHEVLAERARQRDVVLTLHWTWEVNIGLSHMEQFLTAIPKELFADFDA